MILLLFQVPFMFLPRDRGDYAQFWDLECHPVSEPQQKDRIRFQLCGTVRTPFISSEGIQPCREWTSFWLGKRCRTTHVMFHSGQNTATFVYLGCFTMIYFFQWVVCILWSVVALSTVNDCLYAPRKQSSGRQPKQCTAVAGDWSKNLF